MTSFAAIDFETANQHRSSICSVGVVVVENAAITGRFYELVKPAPNFYTHWNTEIHGIRFEDTARAKTFPEVWESLFKKIQGLPLVAHSSGFENSCLRAVHEFYELDCPRHTFVCTCQGAKKCFPNLPNHRLDTVTSHLGIHLAHHHNALTDAEACAKIAMKIFNFQTPPPTC